MQTREPSKAEKYVGGTEGQLFPTDSVVDKEWKAVPETTVFKKCMKNNRTSVPSSFMIDHVVTMWMSSHKHEMDLSEDGDEVSPSHRDDC